MVFAPVNQKATIVALDFAYGSVFDFIQILKRKGIYAKFCLEEIDMPVIIEEDFPNKDQIIKNFKTNIPISSFKTPENINITFAAFQRKLDIIENKFNPNNYSKFKSIANNLIDLRISDITTIGINFIADFELGDIRLKLLNEEIRNIENFDKNLTFQLIIPLKFDDYIATYKIQKLILPDFSNKENRTYQIDVNFNIDLSNDSCGEKLRKIENYLDNLKDNLYSDFYNKCQEFLSLHYE